MNNFGCHTTALFLYTESVAASFSSHRRLTFLFRRRLADGVAEKKRGLACLDKIRPVALRRCVVRSPSRLTPLPAQHSLTRSLFLWPPQIPPYKFLALQREKLDTLMLLNMSPEELRRRQKEPGSCRIEQGDRLRANCTYTTAQPTNWVMLCLSPAQASRATVEALDRGTGGGVLTVSTGSPGTKAWPFVMSCAAKEVRGQSSLGCGTGAGSDGSCRSNV